MAPPEMLPNQIPSSINLDGCTRKDQQLPETMGGVDKRKPVRSWSDNSDFSDVTRSDPPRSEVPEVREPSGHGGSETGEELGRAQNGSSYTSNGSTCLQTPFDAARDVQSSPGDTLSPPGNGQGVDIKLARRGEVDISHAGTHLEPEVPVIHEDEKDQSSVLVEQLQNAIESQQTTSPFIPLNAQKKLITRSAIKEELEIVARKYKRNIDDNLDHWTSKIFDPILTSGKPSRTSSTTSRVLLFSILLLAGYPHRIFAFIRKDIYDKDLPFDCNTTQPTVDQSAEDVVRPPTKVDLLTEWPTTDLLAFNNIQWYFLAPFFNMQDGKVQFYPLRNMVPLPFLACGSKREIIAGGFGQVFKVEIHPAHHNYPFSDPSEANTPSCDADQKWYFAVKKLICPNGEDPERERKLFEKEVKALKRFNNAAKNKHFIKLLSTYYYEGHYHLIFPWANGNLREYWQATPLPAHDYENLLWISEQCAGLTEALKMLHNDEFKITETSETLSLPAGQSEGARHGDVKPTNILWFNTKDGVVLKLSDFGLTRFHRKVSELRMYDRVIGSWTYRAPECDLQKSISPMYDMWSLGCVFLEFLSWYMLGFEKGIELFTSQRVAEDNAPHIRGDSFFNAAMTEEGAKYGAYLKLSVIKRIEDLYASDLATRFIWDFLDLINNNLLRIRMEKRNSSVKAFFFLEQWYNKCACFRKYCIDLPSSDDREFKRRKTNESDLPPPPPGQEKPKPRRTSLLLSRNSTFDITASTSGDSVSRGGPSPPPSPLLPGNPQRYSGREGMRALVPTPVREDSQEALSDDSQALAEIAGTAGRGTPETTQPTQLPPLDTAANTSTTNLLQKEEEGDSKSPRSFDSSHGAKEAMDRLEGRSEGGGKTVDKHYREQEQNRLLVQGLLRQEQLDKDMEKESGEQLRKEQEREQREREEQERLTQGREGRERMETESDKQDRERGEKEEIAREVKEREMCEKEMLEKVKDPEKQKRVENERLEKQTHEKDTNLRPLLQPDESGSLQSGNTVKGSVGRYLSNPHQRKRDKIATFFRQFFSASMKA